MKTVAADATLISAILAMLGIASLAQSATPQNWGVVSPNGQVKIAVHLADAAEQPDTQGKACLYYRVELGKEDFRTAVILDSPLGLMLQGQDFLQKLRFESADSPKRVEESYTMPHGKRRECGNVANQLTLAFRNPSGQLLALDLRAYNDGVAFRYRLPGTGTNVQVLESEATSFALPQNARLWMHPNDKPGTYAPAYETYFENEIPLGTPSPTGVGWAFPVLFRTSEARQWALITEANVGPNFCGARLASTAPDGVYRMVLPDAKEGNGTGSVKPSATLPWEMPWRVIILGNSLGTIVESTLVNDLSKPSQLKDTDWVRPGRVAWSWWSDNPSPQDGAKQRKFIDLAAKMGWEYVLVDANWTIMDNGTIHDVLRYAKRKGVGVLLWYNSGGPHNVVTEKPRDCFTYPEVRRFEFDLLRKWGVKGVKVDFFQSDKQNVIQLYHDILKDAAEYHIMVNFHGCTLPRGWERTWPHLMSMEAVKGEECYIFGKEFPERAPVQNTITPFTRNVVGPMDYTPVGFSDNKYPHLTTSAHELALSVLFETGWLHFADKPEAYLDLPSAPKEFLKKVPVAWDDTRLVAGYPGKYVILARRKGATWYLAGVNGQNQRVEESLKFGPWLADGRYELTRITDGPEPRKLRKDTQVFETLRNDLKVKIPPYGGFAGTLKPIK